MPSMSAGGAASGALIEIGGDALGAIDVDADKAVADRAVVDSALELGQRDALTLAIALRAAANCVARSAIFASSLLLGAISSTSRHCTARLPLDAFLDGAEEIRMVAADLALVDQRASARRCPAAPRAAALRAAPPRRRHRRPG